VDTASLVDHQILVEATVKDGVVTLKLPNGQTVVWPVTDANLVAGQFYLTLSSSQTLPTKEELARLILKEILKRDG
jgi:hypothetical protein